MNKKYSRDMIGYGSKKLTLLKKITIAPGYQSSITYIVLAQDLYKDSAEGDEPEPLEVVEKKYPHWKVWFMKMI